MAAAASSEGKVYGVITLDGIDYVERFQVFVTEVIVPAPSAVITNQRLTLPGVANFLLKGLTRDFSLAGQPDSEPENFRFRMINSEGTTWFSTGGLGVFDDRAIDDMCFGSGQFPFPLIPPVPIHSTGTIVYEVEDLGFRPNLPTLFPYTIHFGWQGTYLFPAEDAPTRGPLAFPGVTRGIIRTRR